MSDDLTLYTLPNNQPVVALECETAFKTLTQREKLYAHYLSHAAWNGGLIVLIQTSPESPLIFALLHKIYLAESIDELKNAVTRANVTEDDFTVRREISLPSIFILCCLFVFIDYLFVDY